MKNVASIDIGSNSVVLSICRKADKLTEIFHKSHITQLGKNHSEVLELDQQKFKDHFINLCQSYEEMDSRICFELIHEAFDKAYRIPENSSQKDKTTPKISNV